MAPGWGQLRTVLTLTLIQDLALAFAWVVAPVWDQLDIALTWHWPWYQHWNNPGAEVRSYLGSDLDQYSFYFCACDSIHIHMKGEILCQVQFCAQYHCLVGLPLSNECLGPNPCFQGLIPFLILPYLNRKVRWGQVRQEQSSPSGQVRVRFTLLFLPYLTFVYLCSIE